MNESILYIEDEVDFQLLVNRLLTREGFAVTIAGTGQEGLSLLGRSRPSLAILDVNLPDTTGYELCRQLRQDPTWSDLPILMLTVRRRPEEWLEGYAAGANDYVSKPINPPEMLDRVRFCLESKLQTKKGDTKAEYLMTQAVIAGNKGAYDVLIRQYRPRLLEAMTGQVGIKNEAEDIVAAAFMKALERLPQYRGESSFYTWLYSIAWHEFSHRRRHPHISLSDEFESTHSLVHQPRHARHPQDGEVLGSDIKYIHRPLMVEAFNGSDSVSNNVQLLEQAVSRIPEPYRQILKLHFFNEMSYAAIATYLKIPEGTVMSRLSKARQLLRMAWSDVEYLGA